MRKLIAFMCIFFFTFFLKNEEASSKSSCTKCNAGVKKRSTSNSQQLNAEADGGGDNMEPKQYDGFFFKI